MSLSLFTLSTYEMGIWKDAQMGAWSPTWALYYSHLLSHLPTPKHTSLFLWLLLPAFKKHKPNPHSFFYCCKHIWEQLHHKSHVILIGPAGIAIQTSRKGLYNWIYTLLFFISPELWVTQPWWSEKESRQTPCEYAVWTVVCWEERNSLCGDSVTLPACMMSVGTDTPSANSGSAPEFFYTFGFSAENIWKWK